MGDDGDEADDDEGDDGGRGVFAEALGEDAGARLATRLAARAGRGVCGTCADTRQVQIVPDVHAFSGHIACDSASNAELVLPVVVGEKLIGVFDLDSPVHGRFDGDDADGLSAMLATLVHGTHWGALPPTLG